jgi:hypothetical protein
MEVTSSGYKLCYVVIQGQLVCCVLDMDMLKGVYVFEGGYLRDIITLIKKLRCGVFICNQKDYPMLTGLPVNTNSRVATV